jgi:hypothetical protein
MDSGRARKLYEKYAGAMAYVSIEDAQGDRRIGSAFHIGEGVFVTARHVVEGNRILEMAMTEPADIRLTGADAVTAKTKVRKGDEEFAFHRVDNGVLHMSQPPRFHRDTDVDVAVFEVSGIDPLTPYAPLGAHMDDWIGRGDFVLTEAIILGYPPISIYDGTASRRCQGGSQRSCRSQAAEKIRPFHSFGHAARRFQRRSRIN